MAWSKVSGATLVATRSTSESTWNAGSLGGAVEAGDRLVAVVALYTSTGNQTNSIADSLSNTWVLLYRGAAYSSTVMEIWTCVSAAGTPSNLTFTLNTTITVKSIACAAYRGLDTTASTACLDGTPLSATATDASPDSGTTPGTTGAANGLKVGAYTDAGYSRTITAGSSDTTYTRDAHNSPTNQVTAALETADSGAAGSTARATFGSNGSAPWRCTVLVIKALAAAGVSIPVIMAQYRQRHN